MQHVHCTMNLGYIRICLTFHRNGEVRNMRSVARLFLISPCQQLSNCIKVGNYILVYSVYTINVLYMNCVCIIFL